MKKIIYSSLILILAVFMQSCEHTIDSATKYSLIPLPYQIQEDARPFELNQETRIVYSGQGLESSAKSLQEDVYALSDIKLQILSESEAKNLQNVILLSTQAKEERLGKEGYRMMVDKDKVIISSNDADGIFYAVQTLYQLFELQQLDEGTTALIIPAIRIWDEPRFPYR